MSTPGYSDLSERIVKALTVAFEYGQFDGDHHKLWCIDQMVRALCGDEFDYDQWVENYEGDGEYTWDTGVAP